LARARAFATDKCFVFRVNISHSTSHHPHLHLTTKTSNIKHHAFFFNLIIFINT